MFRVGVPLHVVKPAYEKLSKSAQEHFQADLKQIWDNWEIPAHILPPFIQVAILRPLIITELNDHLFQDSIKMVHMEGLIVNSSINDVLAHHEKGSPLPRPPTYHLLSIEDVKEIQANLVLLDSRLKVYLSCVSQDDKSVAMLSEIRRVFLGARYEVYDGADRSSLEDVPSNLIAVNFPKQPPSELSMAVSTLCSRLNKHISYRERLDENALVLRIGPP